MTEPIESVLRDRLDEAIRKACPSWLHGDSLKAFRQAVIGGAIIGIACAMEHIEREEGAESEPLKDLRAAACRLGLESVGAVGRDFGKMQ